MKLENRIALISGASSGIGKAIAIASAKEGAKIAATGRNKERLTETEKEITAAGGTCICFEADLTKVSDMDKVIEKTVDHYGRLDILFNAAGIAEFIPFFEITEELYDQVLDTNLKSQFFMSQRAAKEMKKQSKGKIVCMASIAGIIGIAHLAAYCASKAGVVGMVKALAVALAPYKINVNAISPGNILSPMNEEKFKDPEYLKANLAVTPWSRIGQTSDVTPAAIYLASDDADYITGTQIVIDGGMTIP